MLGRKSKTLGVKAAPAKHGMGLFATRRFQAGQAIGELTGKRIDDSNYGSEYCIDLGDDWSLEPDEPYRFVNHCCTPNAKLYLIFDDDDPIDKRKVVLEATRSIQAGMEVTIDYEWPADGAIRCGCDSAECRGWVVDPAELHLLKKKAR
ncbi:MAG: SET domain-containing protein-lysine N-methyltransferase [Planctomycetota bacterium]|nr:SET domain-containing protein-lysine N-methyltransferase [Planctomycetota bacterium]MDA1161651.1 SET domain-containing protein-lysine N-methyltransferase [Planctomycetota bacterium]